jgi:hypothetical protein
MSERDLQLTYGGLTAAEWREKAETVHIDRARVYRGIADAMEKITPGLLDPKTEIYDEVHHHTPDQIDELAKVFPIHRVGPVVDDHGRFLDTEGNLLPGQEGES